MFPEKEKLVLYDTDFLLLLTIHKRFLSARRNAGKDCNTIYRKKKLLMNTTSLS